MIGESTEGGGRRKVFGRAGEAAGRLTAIAAVALFALALVVSPAAAARGDARAAALERRLGQGAEVKAHEETGKVRFIGTEPGEPIAAPNGASPPAAARAFLDDHAKAFGLDDASRELRVEATDDLANGRSSVRLQQLHRGVPVIAGELVVNLDARRTCSRRAERLRRSTAST